MQGQEMVPAPSLPYQICPAGHPHALYPSQLARVLESATDACHRACSSACAGRHQWFFRDRLWRPHSAATHWLLHGQGHFIVGPGWALISCHQSGLFEMPPLFTAWQPSQALAHFEPSLGTSKWCLHTSSNLNPSHPCSLPFSTPPFLSLIFIKVRLVPYYFPPSYPPLLLLLDNGLVIPLVLYVLSWTLNPFFLLPAGHLLDQQAYAVIRREYRLEC